MRQSTLVLPVEAAPYLPHAAPMVLIDRITGWAEDTIESETTPGEHAPFAENGQVPAWVALEYMAQTIGAYAGLTAARDEQPVRIGFLLGTRKLELYAAHFACGQTLRVRATRLAADANGLGSFDCELARGSEVLARGRLNVYQPADPAAVLAGA